MTLKELIYEVKPVFETLLNEENLKAKTSYKILKNFESIEKEVQAYERTRIKLLNDYAEKDEKGEPIIENNQYKLNDEVLQKVNDEINDLLNEDVEIDFINIDFEEIKEAKLSPLKISRIEFLFEH